MEPSETRLNRSRVTLERSVEVPLSDLLNHGETVESSQMQTQYAFQEAAIYLDKGISNEKYHTFYEEQSDKIRFQCYLIGHTTICKVLDVAASLVLLALAAIEPPAMLGMDVPIWVHGTLELISLLTLVVLFVIRIKWQGINYSWHHKRTMFKMVLIITMFVEVIVVMVRRDSHVRVTRSLRPLFLLDTHYFGGVRRVFREILKSIPPVMDILVLLLFFMVIFAMLGVISIYLLLRIKEMITKVKLTCFFSQPVPYKMFEGFYFFSTNEKDPNFSTYQQSFISLFVLITTANYPDVMMPAYNVNKAAVIFFVVYIAIALYFFMNLLLATVYSTFTYKNKEKFKRLYLHKREGAALAYKKISDPVNGGLDLPTFRKFMTYYKPRMSPLDTVLVFKHLNKIRSDKIRLEEFYNIYGATGLSWRKDIDGEWFYSWNLPKPLTVIMKKIHEVVTKRFKKTIYSYFDICIYAVIIINGCIVMYEIIIFSNAKTEERDFMTVHWYSHIFTAIYALEAALKILGLGPYTYFTSYWNCFDMLVTILNVLGSLNQKLGFAIFLRPIRLLLLFKLKKSYRVVFDTLRILLKSLLKLGIVIVLVYYFFAIVGIEAFSGLKLKSCCRNLSIASEYEEGGYYYLNNFDDLFHSFVTLFELTVINNWHVIMEGFVNVTNEWSRIFFMLFYLLILVVMTIVVAFILDAFVFSIELKRKNSYEASTHKVVSNTYLTKDELKNVDPKLVRGHEERILYTGTRFLTRDDLFEKMHIDELNELCRDFDNTLRANQSNARENMIVDSETSSSDAEEETST